MRVLVGCEFSGMVRQAFTDKGHDAWSCDLLPSERPYKHIVGDCLELLHGRPLGTFNGDEFADLSTGDKERVNQGIIAEDVAWWELLIAHPPCTYLCNSGVRWLAPGGVLNEERHKLMMKACDLFAVLYHAPIKRVCIENPVMHKYARDYLASAWKVPSHSQTIQPWQFGHGEVKRTCFWLKNLPLLTPTLIVPGRTPRVHHASPGENRWKERSRTLSGIAEAMAKQWG